jgi:hypothetical protein
MRLKVIGRRRRRANSSRSRVRSVVAADAEHLQIEKAVGRIDDQECLRA